MQALGVTIGRNKKAEVVHQTNTKLLEGEEKKFEKEEIIMNGDIIEKASAAVVADDDDKAAAVASKSNRAAAKEKQQNKEKQSSTARPVDALPDMTGKIITVSAEETLQLTKERGKSRSGRRRGVDGDKNNKDASKPALSSSQQERQMAGIEKEFQDFIAMNKSSDTRDQLLDNDDEVDKVDKPITSAADAKAIAYSRQLSSGIDDGMTNVAMVQRKSELLADIDDSEPPSRRGSDYTNTTTNDNKSIDSWSNTDDGPSKNKSSLSNLLNSSSLLGGELPTAGDNTTTSTLHDDSHYPATAQSSPKPTPSAAAAAAAKREEDIPINTCLSSTITRLRSRRGLSQTNPYLHSSLRSIKEKKSLDGGSTVGGGSDTAGMDIGISWSSLISMESKAKQEQLLAAAKNSNRSSLHGSATSGSVTRRKGRDKGHCSSSYTSTSTPESKMRASITSKNSHSSKRSHGSKESRSSRSRVSWKNESSISYGGTSSSNNKDTKYIRRQSHERFQRGIYYAKRGQYAFARERFLMALRYRVMHYGPAHYHVAAVHEMLGYLNCCLSEEDEDNGTTDEDEFETSLVRGDKKSKGKTKKKSGGLEEEDLTQSMLGWDVTLLEKERSKNSKSNVHLQKAAMHYRTVLDILGAKNNIDTTLDDSTTGKPSATNTSISWGTAGEDDDDNSIKWAFFADSYTDLGDGDENLQEIITRVQDKLSSLPAAVTKAVKSKSYVSGIVG